MALLQSSILKRIDELREVNAKLEKTKVDFKEQERLTNESVELKDKAEKELEALLLEIEKTKKQWAKEQEDHDKTIQETGQRIINLTDEQNFLATNVAKQSENFKLEIADLTKDINQLQLEKKNLSIQNAQLKEDNKLLKEQVKEKQKLLDELSSKLEAKELRYNEILEAITAFDQRVEEFKIYEARIRRYYLEAGLPLKE